MEDVVAKLHGRLHEDMNDLKEKLDSNEVNLDKALDEEGFPTDEFLAKASPVDVLTVSAFLTLKEVHNYLMVMLAEEAAVALNDIPEDVRNKIIEALGGKKE